MKSILTALTLSTVLASHSWSEERQYLCISQHEVGYRGVGTAESAEQALKYGVYSPFSIKRSTGKYVLKVNGDQLSLKGLRKTFPSEIGSANCGFVLSPVNKIKTAVCTDEFWNFHMNPATLRFVASSTSIDGGFGTFSQIGSCKEF